MPDLANLDQALMDIWDEQIGIAEVGKVARAIAKSLDDNIDLAFLSKSSWTHAGGKAVDGSFRDVNAPLRGDYIAAALVAISAAQPSILEAMRRAYRLAEAKEELARQFIKGVAFGLDVNSPKRE